MENIKSLRIPAYAIVDAETSEVVVFRHNRQEARNALQEVKKCTKDFNRYKIAKLTFDKFIR